MNKTRTYPGWIPPQFHIPANSPDAVCRSPENTLLLLGVYNIIAIAEFLATHNKYVQAYLSRLKNNNNNKHWQRPWSFSHVLTKLPWQTGGMVLSSYFTVNSAATIWHMLQIWTIRPRVTWFIGNLARLKREWGYANHALSSVVLEVFICAFSMYFVGSLLATVLFYGGDDKTTWYTVMVGASVVMMISSAFETLWALWMVLRFCVTGGRGEADDVDALVWIAKTFVPVTYVCSWLIWAAYLYSSPEAYCPVHQEFINAVWIVVPFLTTFGQLVTGNL